jgi:cyclin H
MVDENRLFTLESLQELREQANQEARSFIRNNFTTYQCTHASSVLDDGTTPQSSDHLFPIMSVKSYACLNGGQNHQELEQSTNEGECGLSFLTVIEEQALIRFYASKIFSLVGPNALVPRLQKDIKVASTAAILFRKFFLSNSVLMYDPKAIMVAAVFLASKVEDSTVDVSACYIINDHTVSHRTYEDTFRGPDTFIRRRYSSHERSHFHFRDINS